MRALFISLFLFTAFLGGCAAEPAGPDLELEFCQRDSDCGVGFCPEPGRAPCPKACQGEERCPADLNCYAIPGQSWCLQINCQPHCDGRQCGQDGCGGSCGSCAAGQVCSEGICACQAQDATACHQGDVWWFDSCGQPENLLASCPHGCQDGGCLDCQPACDGLVCGQDGCGGSCGSCAAGQVCSEGICACQARAATACHQGDLWWFDSCGQAGSLLENCLTGCQDGACLACQPDCAGLQCGPDGCGGSCGACAAGSVCRSGACLASGVTFAALADVELAGSDPGALVGGDFDADGHLDLALAMSGFSGGDGKVSVLFGDGLGGFADEPFTVLYRPSGLVSLRSDGDARSDLVVTASGSGVYEVYSYLSAGIRALAGVDTAVAGQSPQDVVSADFDLDGRADLAVANGQTPGLTIHRGLGGGMFTDGLTVPDAAFMQVFAVKQEDLDRDGLADLVTPQAVFFGFGDGTFVRGRGFGGSAQVAIGDRDGDGLLDVIVLAGDQVLVWVGDGAGDFQVAEVLQLSATAADLIAADLDGDARVDLIIAQANTNALHVYLANAPGLEPLSLSVCAEPTVVGALDVDADGLLDLLAACRQGGQTPLLSVLRQVP